MKVFTLTDSLHVIKDPVVTLGSFDGVHLGHRKLLDAVKAKAAATGGESVVVTFSRHPRQVLPDGGEVRLLNTLKEKLYLLEEEGVDNVFVLPFDKQMSLMSFYDFIKEIMVGRIGMKWLVVGYDHHFGRGQEGNHDSLRNLKEELGFGLERVEEYTAGGTDVSSSEVRRLISYGDMGRAAQLLGRGYIVAGDIKNGILVPEDSDKLLPPPGLYAVRLEYDDFKENDTLKIDHEGVMHLEKECKNCKDALVTFG